MLNFLKEYATCPTYKSNVIHAVKLIAKRQKANEYAISITGIKLYIMYQF